MKAKKFIEKKKVGSYEIIKNYILYADITKEELNELCEYLDTEWDYEQADKIYGITFDYDSEIFSVDVEKLVNKIKELEKDDILTDHPVSIEKTIHKLDKYKEYTLFP